MPFSPWPLPPVPDVDLASFALRHAARLAGRPALIDDRVVTYGELAERVERAAPALRGRAVVPVQLPNGADFVVQLLAGLRAGAAVTTVSPLYTEREVTNHLRIAQTLSEPGDIALLLSSSGTTGLPKVVQLSHRAVVANLCQTTAVYPYNEGERVLGLAPFFHSMGLIVVLLHALASGATVVVMPRFDPEAMLATIDEHQVSQVLIPPPVLQFLARHPLIDRFDLSSLNVVGCGGAPPGAELTRAAGERLDCLVAEGYGITEFGPMVAVSPMQPDLVRHGSVGHLMPGTEGKIVDGEVWVRGPQRMSGYLGNPEATAATIDADGWLHTGDTGRFDDDGYLYLGDRIKELIKVKGFQVAPAELEAVLRLHPAVADAAVVRVPDSETGERPKAFVVTRGELDVDELRSFVAEQVAEYKRIDEIEEIDALPRSPTGKLLRRMLVAEAVAS
ncbi:MAG TPA: AMP-binding protein [Solirubrobacteraceae bacterium]|nr:AMP-binding protein [Solirubrobacteraceae bacterium]